MIYPSIYFRMKTLLFFAASLLMYSSGFSQNVGIGTLNPSATFEVKGKHRMGGLNNFISFYTISGKILWTNAKLFVPSPHYLMQHSASAEGLCYGISQI